MIKILRNLIVLLATTLLPMLAFGQAEPVKWEISTRQSQGDVFDIVFTANIESPWHMYDMGPYEDGPIATSITVKPISGATLSGGVYTSSISKVAMDDIFEMEIGHFEGQAVFIQKVTMTATKAKFRASAEWMVCNDNSCMPPSDAEFDIEISHPRYAAAEQDGANGQATVTPVEQTASIAIIDEIAADDSDTVKIADTVSEVSAGKTEAEGGSIWGYIIEAILWGLAALLTPCVFPMIPMTISFFLKNQGSPAKGKFMASMYGVFIVALYTLPVVALILTTKLVGGNDMTIGFFNWLSTHWIPNIIFFLVFMVFAASFFGAFEITLPSKLVNRSDRKADRGGLAGTFFMALTLVLVSFSCTGPIVSTILIKSTQGEIWTPVFTMLAFSITFAIPFTLFAVFPSLMNGLKSGSWLNSVKVVLGFIEVALGLKFLSVADQTYHWGILDREIYLAIWIVVFALLGVYLLGKIKFKHDSDVKHLSVTRLFLSIVTFSFVVYMVPGMWGAPLKGLSGYLPPISTQDFVLKEGAVGVGSTTAPTTVKYGDKLHLPHSLEGFFDLEQAQRHASAVGKPLFIDITGHGCVNCREMEARVWSDPRVLELLRSRFVIVALYTDDKMTAEPEDWITTTSGKQLTQLGKINAYTAYTQFGVSAQPYYIITGHDGERLADHQYDLSIDNFLEFLNRGLNAY